ncbi:MAG: S46 family peptidase [Mediterranea sp.]|jgi:hypothetical protein|nr:S46 family peptidase [Mediterranea sp.]
MKRESYKLLLGSLLCLLLALPARAADDGFWLPTQITGKVYRMMKKEGVRLSEQEIFDANRACLSNAILSLSSDDGTFTPFATASFVSPDGLVLTNFHCVARYLDQASDARHDYVRDGCWSTRREEEMRLYNLQVNQLLSMRDVTAAMKQHTDTLAGAALERQITRNASAVMKEAGGRHGATGKIYSLFGGQQYVLALFRSFKDVRIAAAPPIALGKFGGDTDNWQWPRYSADFALLRVYVDGKPYQPQSYLRLATKGLKEGDCVMVAGYPAQTRHYIPSFALSRIVFRNMQAEADMVRAKLDYYTRQKERHRSDSLYTYYSVEAGSAANVYLKDRGIIDGVRQSALVQQKEREEQALTDWIGADADRSRRYGNHLLADMRANYEPLSNLNLVEAMFRQVALNGAAIIPFAGKFEKLVEMARSHRKNVAKAMAGEVRRLRPLTEAFYRHFRLEDDREVMKRLLAIYLTQVDSAYYSPELKRVALYASRGALGSYVDTLYAHTPLRDRQQAWAFLDSVPTMGVEALRRDPLYQLALGFYFTQVDKVNRQKARYEARNRTFYATYLQAYAEKNTGEPLPFDANRTLRYSVGHVRAASPEEGVTYTPFTTLDGLLERARAKQGEPDFALPRRLVPLVEGRNFGSYGTGGTAPVCCFLTDALTTSGSSGSPVLNGKGELVGINFDRIRQGVVSDYRPDPAKSRCIVVDIRYVLWLIGRFSPSAYLLDELL